MKRNKISTRAMRHQTNVKVGNVKGKSRYAKKFRNGNQMYGPGCCAHSITQAQVDAAKRDAELARRAASYEGRAFQIGG